mmetsp:Transcript_13775/g.18381  ORF Transcript_13775/g.18381 Transcript_13775/m.18381 type:complete len:540 (-) Transcript_13775:95-1714(-)|eukprot:CAMPEP_0197293696 /NCGR_PEP_ID=MMETSP0890-20130614/29591_1 /TAXON_ID=44058 ORGANISM="Aureoumbra lagunensis, Strain CCMP1510" /NCGR_SAMPLE_ID=MMETSP0890 /ASSEMBLY_ACC=CAM_ASM_000533 /LENGTH=539 /DNA_ID=CAMNT_0042768657 /DNA_START=17 /DNA_END=1636 /DNA_ORIENTATION=-
MFLISLCLIFQDVKSILVVDRVASAIASVARMPVALGSSLHVSQSCVPREEEPSLLLFDQATNAQSRSVREALTYLDLSVTIYPCATGSRHVYATTPWKSAFRRPKIPVLVDGTERITGANDIVEYLLEKYEECDPPRRKKRSFGLDYTAHTIASAARLYRGNTVSRDALLTPPKEPLRLYTFEGCQCSRLVKERLYELDLPFENIACGVGSRRRASLENELQKAQFHSGSRGQIIPYLIDPNTSFKSIPGDPRNILRYLDSEYTRADNNLPKEPRPHSALRRRSLKAVIALLSERTRRGLDEFEAADRKLFEYALSKLININPTTSNRRFERSRRGGPLSSGLIDDKWNLLWTSKPRLLQFMRDGMMGIPCQSITQAFDLSKSRFENIIIFAPSYEDRFIDDPDAAPVFVRHSYNIQRAETINTETSDESVLIQDEVQHHNIANEKDKTTTYSRSSVPSLLSLIATEDFKDIGTGNSDDTLLYKCSSRILKFDNEMSVPLPPVDGGTLTIVYLDDDFCIQLLSNGDYLILSRRLFSGY